jgi:hypothetical protein
MEESEIKENGKKDKEKGRWTKKMGTEKKCKRKKRYEGEGTSKEITETAKVRILYWNVAGLRKKEQEF